MSGVNTNKKIMAWMMDTYSMNLGSTASGGTGKPVSRGGSRSWHEATGRSMFVVSCKAAAKYRFASDGAHVAIQDSAIPATTVRESSINVLHGNGTLVAPDVIANTGSVTVSYFEWGTGFSGFFWTKDEINEPLICIIAKPSPRFGSLQRTRRYR